MKAFELRKKTADDLRKQVIEGRDRLRQLRFDLAGGKVKNVREIRNTKKLVAQILTILRQTK